MKNKADIVISSFVAKDGRIMISVSASTDIWELTEIDRLLMVKEGSRLYLTQSEYGNKISNAHEGCSAHMLTEQPEKVKALLNYTGSYELKHDSQKNLYYVETTEAIRGENNDRVRTVNLNYKVGDRTGKFPKTKKEVKRVKKASVEDILKETVMKLIESGEYEAAKMQIDVLIAAKEKQDV